MKIYALLLAAAFFGPCVTADDKLRRTLRMSKKKKSSSGKGGKGGRSKEKSVEFEVKLTPGNEITPFMGVEFAFGTAEVEITSTKACISASIEGFVPGAAHIHVGPIDDNGAILVDFTPLLSMGKSDFDGCISISKMLSERIMERPVRNFTCILPRDKFFVLCFMW